MRIGLISDTRVPGVAKEVPPQVVRAFEGVDLILHAGGIYTSAVLDWLEHMAPVKAVGRIVADRAEGPRAFSIEGQGDARIADQQVLELEGHAIGMVNNLEMRGMSYDVMPGFIETHRLPNQSLPMMVEGFFGTAVDIVIFGRTLYALVEEHQGVLFINPGSPTLPKNQVKLGSVAILDLTPEGREARIIDLATGS
jgi:putative phosphoesterase